MWVKQTLSHVHTWPAALEGRNQEKPTSRCSPSRALYVWDPSMFLCVQPQRHHPVRGPLRARAATVSRCVACMPYPAATWLPARPPAWTACCLPSASFFFFSLSARVGAMRRRCSAARVRPHRAIALCSRPPPARRSDVLRSYSIFLGPAAGRSQAARVLAARTCIIVRSCLKLFAYRRLLICLLYI